MKTKFLLALVFVTALAVRLIYFKNATTFFYDQARDALTSMEIWQNDPIKILGPQTDFPGLHHGPLYWYLISPVYHFSQGNVWAVRFFLILLNCLSIFFIYDLSQALFKNRKVSLLACIFFAFSFEATQYARWLSNPAPSILSITISFWAIYQLIKGKGWAIIPLFIAWAISIQLQLFLLYQGLVFVIIWLTIKKFTLPNSTPKQYLIALGSFLIILASYVIAEFKFNFQGVRAFMTIFSGHTQFSGSFVSTLTGYIDRTANIFYLNIWGINIFLAGLATIITLSILINLLKNKTLQTPIVFLLIWMLSPIIINFFSGPNANFLTIGAMVPVIIATSYLINNLFTKSKLLFYLLIIVILGENINLILSQNKNGEVLFTVQNKMILGDELKVIDYVYGQSGGKPFKINTITYPLFINSTWAELFNWYGKSHYGYMPIWWGEKQVGVPGADIKFADNSPTNIFFLIIEPGAMGDDNYLKAITILENNRSSLVAKVNIGNFIVEKRKVLKDTTYTSGDVFTVIKTTDVLELQKVRSESN